ncbi:uncharacterized protein LOC123537897 [Mercenaria mercenaria]|uniref:uncharacterized protein LOC123537897 n=1 Tax=Mercenaria mercenaria TaxID=6596 RepID=UPI00234E73D7|nr:uncharacterized protein LOC123537897 [Mercenaria mercenaria]XP_053386297.1 uncharacterized protein LOC123537897 [Mercenaria mercenaria]XP_053386298.1 uncharacterized protein LOC123537897 [Mercenaria mercenaria]XP_053386299.1 uncharacterized protein LOC123537897 [Mercenaria mercenaria]
MSCMSFLSRAVRFLCCGLVPSTQEELTDLSSEPMPVIVTRSEIQGEGEEPTPSMANEWMTDDEPVEVVSLVQPVPSCEGMVFSFSNPTVETSSPVAVEVESQDVGQAVVEETCPVFPSVSEPQPIENALPRTTDQLLMVQEQPGPVFVAELLPTLTISFLGPYKELVGEDEEGDGDSGRYEGVGETFSSSYPTVETSSPVAVEVESQDVGQAVVEETCPVFPSVSEPQPIENALPRTTDQLLMVQEQPGPVFIAELLPTLTVSFLGPYKELVGADEEGAGDSGRYEGVGETFSSYPTVETSSPVAVEVKSQDIGQAVVEETCPVFPSVSEPQPIENALPRTTDQLLMVQEQPGPVFVLELLPTLTFSFLGPYKEQVNVEEQGYRDSGRYTGKTDLEQDDGKSCVGYKGTAAAEDDQVVWDRTTISELVDVGDDSRLDTTYVIELTNEDSVEESLNATYTLVSLEDRLDRTFTVDTWECLNRTFINDEYTVYFSTDGDEPPVFPPVVDQVSDFDDLLRWYLREWNGDVLRMYPSRTRQRRVIC